MKTKMEIRTISLRADGGQAADPQMTLRGRAVTYNSLSKPMPSQRGFTFRELVRPGAFTRSLADAKSDVICTFNHNNLDIPLGRTKSGTLTLQDSPEGLNFACRLDSDNQDHRNLYSAVKRGDISQCSWGFQADDDEWDDGDQTCIDDDGNRCSRRSINSATLYSVDVVTNPAYDATSVDARSFVDKLFRTKKSFEQEFIDRNHYDPWLMQMRAARYGVEIRRDAALVRIMAKHRADAERRAAAARAEEQRQREIAEVVRDIFPVNF